MIGTLLLAVPAVAVPAAGVCRMVHSLAEKRSRKMRKQELYSLLEEKRYFEGISFEISWLFGAGRTSRVLDVSKKEVEEFRNAEKYAEYLYSHFSLRINSETLDHLVNCYLWVRAADRICDAHPEFEEFRESVYPTFYLRYMSRGFRDFAVGEYRFTQENIRNLYNEIWFLLNEKAKEDNDADSNQ